MAALIAWGLIWLADMLGAVLAPPLLGQTFRHSESALGALSALYFFFGLPIAFLVVIAGGWPLWYALDRQGVRGPRNALAVGAAFGLALGVCANAGDYTLIPIGDDVPIATVWALKAVDVAVTAVIGALTGFIAWRCAQPKAEAQTS